ncbi:2-dehydropantoate 2-reductase [Pseudoroseomonas wenyumeiae]|uniref:2-dehydropantoate 2-reductase n=1 Tax=Teichococcus wenyumeiae TaxID=2478470 RepID=A0A3A9JK22_9PROT|nr:2-dehydropantoate 2-reductase [Pseudoroseomonas wenyumeiae]RKK05133.1 2-dehydropantoate 2-reductase [Pseudoroseomonas wenyumeiae]RMI20023.1 2-dehydropantoate 2-reductase [Pseudoroseomonas wenyumeiae]
MKICVFGAGAIGGHVATRLALGGADVSVVARGAHRDAMAAEGLTVEAKDGTHKVHPRVGSPQELGVQDAVIVTVKAPALPSVAEAIGPLLGPETTVAFVMNGIPWWYFDRHGGALDGRRLPEIDPGEAIRKAVGVERTLGGVVYSACTVKQPGHIFVENATNRVVLGEPDGSASPRAEAIAEVLKKGGMGGEVTQDIRGEIWTKLAMNLAFGPFAILSRMGSGGAARDPVVRTAMVRALQECNAIARALGHDVNLDAEKRVASISRSNHKASILQDLELGRPMEVAAMFRVPLEMARMAGVETPVLDLAVALAVQQATEAGLYKPAA